MSRLRNCDFAFYSLIALFLFHRLFSVGAIRLGRGKLGIFFVGGFLFTRLVFRRLVIAGRTAADFDLFQAAVKAIAEMQVIEHAVVGTGCQLDSRE